MIHIKRINEMSLHRDTIGYINNYNDLVDLIFGEDNTMEVSEFEFMYEGNLISTLTVDQDVNEAIVIWVNFENEDEDPIMFDELDDETKELIFDTLL